MNRVIVVAAIIYDQSAENILLAKRPAHKHQGNLWEFPGGKVEPGEKHRVALDRELNEELGISVVECEPVLRLKHDYEDKSVELDVWRVNSFKGKPRGAEGQEIRWVSVAALNDYSFPEANQAILTHLNQSAPQV